MDKVVLFLKRQIKTLRKIKYLRKFNNKQIKEIKYGLVEGLNVEYYAKRCFDENQMREIRYGLEEGLDVSLYAKKEYDSNQMRQIRFKLEKSII